MTKLDMFNAMVEGYSTRMPLYSETIKEGFISKTFLNYDDKGNMAKVNYLVMEDAVELQKLIRNKIVSAVRCGSSDLIVARMEKCEQAVISKRLTELGRLTLCARQLDMLMDHDSSPDFFEKAFIADEIEKFF